MYISSILPKTITNKPKIMGDLKKTLGDGPATALVYVCMLVM